MVARDANEHPGTISGEIQGVAHYTFCARFRVTPFLNILLRYFCYVPRPWLYKEEEEYDCT